VSQELPHQFEVVSPRESSNVAHVCRRSWNLISGGLAFLRSSLNEAVATLRKSRGLPAMVQKTRQLRSHRSPSLSPSAFCAACDKPVVSVDMSRVTAERYTKKE
jgi:hypothetical protein